MTMKGLGRASVELIMVRLPSTSGGLSGLSCPHCDHPLELHQPDAAVPDRILGTCDGCKGWYLLDLLPTGTGAVMARLPEPADSLRAAGHAE